MDTVESYSDAELLKGLRQGSEPAFAEIYRRYSNVLFSTAFNFLKDRRGAEDAVQEIFLDIWKRKAKLEIQSSLEGYLKQSIRYFVLREYKKEQKSVGLHVSGRYHLKNLQVVLMSICMWSFRRFCNGTGSGVRPDFLQVVPSKK